MSCIRGHGAITDVGFRWAILVFPYAPRAVLAPAYIPLLAILLAAFAARVAVFLRRRSPGARRERAP